MLSLGKDVKKVQAVTVAAGAAGTSAINGTTVDLSGFEEILVVVQVGPVVSGAVTSLKWQEGDDSGLSDAADVLGTSVTIADDDDNEVKFLHIIKPRKRYGRVVVSRATQNATVAAMYFLAGARTVPATDGTGVEGESHVSPALGTA